MFGCIIQVIAKLEATLYCNKLNRLIAETLWKGATETVYITKRHECAMQVDSTNLTAPEMEIANRIVLLLLLLLPGITVAQNASGAGTHEVHVGVILDLGSLVGKIAITSISLALEDFYAAHQNYSTKLVLHIRDSKSDDVQAASQGRCLKPCCVSIAFTCYFCAAE